MKPQKKILLTLELICAQHYCVNVDGFTASPLSPSLHAASICRHGGALAGRPSPRTLQSQLTDENDAQDNAPKITALSKEEPELKIQSSTDTTPTTTNDQPPAKTNTVNERLLAEAAAAAAAERAPKTAAGARFKDAFRYNTELTDAQRADNIASARDLNGVNPIVTIVGSFFAFAGAFGLWSGTQWLAGVFLMNPVGEDAPYAFQRAASVFRNGVMGITSLASGFFFVTGLGIFALGVRVAYGVFTGELDPTPIKRSAIASVGKSDDDLVMPNVWDLMMNKKPTRKGGRQGGNTGNDDNPFGL